MDKIRIKGISCPARLGTTVEEREVEQEIVVDLVLFLDLETAAGGDNLELTVDYEQLVEKVRKTVRKGRFQLLESLAGRLCRQVLKDGRIGSVQVTVRKFPEPLRGKVTSVAVEMTRKQ